MSTIKIKRTPTGRVRTIGSPVQSRRPTLQENKEKSAKPKQIDKTAQEVQEIIFGNYNGVFKSVRELIYNDIIQEPGEVWVVWKGYDDPERRERRQKIFLMDKNGDLAMMVPKQNCIRSMVAISQTPALQKVFCTVIVTEERPYIPKWLRPLCCLFTPWRQTEVAIANHQTKAGGMSFPQYVSAMQLPGF